MTLALLAIILFRGLCFGEDKFIYPTDSDRDPFEALINSDGVINIRIVRQLGDLELNGIIYSQTSQERVVIINNTMLKEGESIGTYKIEEISPSQVVLDRNGKKMILKIEKEGK